VAAIREAFAARLPRSAGQKSEMKLMFDCKQVLAELCNYLDGEVSPEVKRALEKHLAKCHRCSLVLPSRP